MKIKLIRKLVPVAVVFLLLGIAIMPSVGAGESEYILTVWMHVDIGDDYYKQIEVTQEQIDEINNSFSALLALIEEVMNNNIKGSNGENITTSEWRNIEASSYEFIDLINDTAGEGFPHAACIELIGTVIGFILGPWYYLRHPVFSVGYGVSFIPWYFYETFIGKLLRPLWITYLAGFTATVHINPFPPRIPYCRLGLHRLRTMLYNGLFIDFGDLGHDRPLGIVMLIGYGFTLTA